MITCACIYNMLDIRQERSSGSILAVPLDKKPPRGNVKALHACTLREVGTE